MNKTHQERNNGKQREKQNKIAFYKPPAAPGHKTNK